MKEDLDQKVDENSVKMTNIEIRKLVNRGDFDKEKFFADFTKKFINLYARKGEAYWESPVHKTSKNFWKRKDEKLS